MNTSKLRQEQLKLAEKIITADMFDDVKYIAGCDQAYIGNNKIVSVVVVMDAETMKIVDKASAEQYCKIPYIPGYLFYREAPSIIEAFTKLDIKPDILMVDANGILHPRRIGMASQLGIALDVPTIGIAKNLLTGRSSDGKIEMDKEIIAEEIRTREFAKPIIVSPGHKISLRTSVNLVRKIIINPHKMPEPLHLAHRFAKKAAGNGGSKDEKEKEEYTAS